MKKGRQSLGIARVRVGDALYNQAIEEVLVPESHKKRVPQEVLDFYRNNAANVNDLGRVIAIIAFCGDAVAGISSCLISEDGSSSSMSMTVVHKDACGRGLGSALFRSKMEIVRSLYVNCRYTTSINKNNSGALTIVRRAGLQISCEHSSESHYLFVG
jgi:GNAT superfamily N-acetyltransferase